MKEMPCTPHAAGLAIDLPARSTVSQALQETHLFADPCKKKGSPTSFQQNIPGSQGVLSPRGDSRLDQRWYVTAKWSHQVNAKSDFPCPCSAFAQPLNEAAEVYQKQMRNKHLSPCLPAVAL